MQTDTGTTKTRARGRKDADKQPAAQRPEVISERIDQLVKLKSAADDASADFADAIARAAEDSGYLAAVVRKFVVARAGENFEEKKRQCEQQMELFDEVGE